jgi:hypothetical protein
MFPSAPLRFTLGLLVVSTLASGGCASDALEAEVEGTATWKNEPLRGVQITFVPEDSANLAVLRSVGITDDEGHYMLNAANGKRGLLAGRYRVVIVDPVSDPGRDLKGRGRVAPGSLRGGSRENPNLPAVYGKPGTTPLHRDVAAGRQTLDFHLPEGG